MIELRVTGMSCKHCVAAVTDALAAVPGVTSVESVNLDDGGASVHGSASVDALISAVKQAGYEATAIS